MPRSLRFWLALALSSLVAVAILAVVSVLLAVLLPRLNEQVAASNRTLGEALAHQVEGSLHGSAAELARLAVEIESAPQASAAQRRIIIDTLANAHAPLDALYLLDAQARVVDVGLPLAWRQTRGELLSLDLSGHGFTSPAPPAGNLWSDSYLSPRGKIVVAVAVPLVKRGGGGSQRRLVGEINLDQLSDYIGELGRAATVLPIVLDRLGQVVAHPDNGRAARQENLANLPLVRAGLAGRFGTERIAFDGREYVATVTPIGTSGWLTLIAVPTEVAFATRRSTLLAIAAGTAAALLLALFSAYVYARQLVRRVGEFSRHLQAIADGDYAAPLPSSRVQELANLAASMRRMANAIIDREAALARSEQHYRALFRDAPLAYQSVDVVSQRIVEVNDAWLDLLGYRRVGVLGRRLSEFVEAASLPLLAASFAHLARTGQTDDLVLDLRHKEDRTVTVLINGRVHHDGQDGARSHCILTDVTQKRSQEEARRQAALLLEHQTERALALLDLPRAAQRMSESEFIQHGLAMAEQLTGSRLAFLYFVCPGQPGIEPITWSHATCRSQFQAAANQRGTISLAGIRVEALRRRAAVVDNECRIALASDLPAGDAGIRRLINMPVIEGGVGKMMLGVGNKPEPYHAGEVETTRLIAQDIWRIVNQRRADEAQRLAATVFAASTSAICITDAELRIVSANPALSAITGYALDEIVGLTPRLFASELQGGKDAFPEMRASIEACGVWVGEIWSRRKSGEVFPASLTITVVRDNDGAVTHYIGSFHDITERKRSEEHIRFLAHHDALTGLPNRALLDDRLRQAIAQSRRDGSHTAVLFLDLDRFKLINDTLGHDVGDRLLACVGERLRTALRETETVARLGGDEFVVVIPGLANIERAGLMAQKVLEVVSAPQSIDERALLVTPSIGIGVYPADGEDVATLLRNADTAMYHAKDCGRNNYQFFTPAMNLAVQERVSIETDLRAAIERGEFELFYQPQVHSGSGAVRGMEALIRWHHPTRGLVPPDRFIPIAEETGLIVPIGEWVLREACRQASAWHAAGQSELRIGVNLSARQLQQANLCALISTILAETGLPASALELELTESMLMVDPLAATDLLHQLAGLGIAIAIDDFGTGYSSLAYLKRFPVTRLKIDRSFVRDISTDANDAAIVRAVVAMAQSLRMEVIAEGVETVEQLRFLEMHGCFEVQGYLFSRPLPVSGLETVGFALPQAA